MREAAAGGGFGTKMRIVPLSAATSAVSGFFLCGAGGLAGPAWGAGAARVRSSFAGVENAYIHDRSIDREDDIYRYRMAGPGEAAACRMISP